MRFLLLNQTFYPDVMATGQYLAEVAAGLAARGHEVTVITSRRAYDQPEMRFAARENWRGVRIYRVACSGFGKEAKWRRALDFATFSLASCIRLVFGSRPEAVVALTSPPLICFMAALYARVRSCRFYYWVMDLNPDEAIAAGWLRADSMAARLLEEMSRHSLRQAVNVVALDRFMRDRVMAKGIEPGKIAVIPPWSLDGEVRFDLEGRNRFRREHKLEGKFVVMYSGNHSPVHPLETLLMAAEQFAGVGEVVFVFVGGGSEWRRIRERQDGRGKERGSVLCLPYQPLKDLSASLCAADVHVVVMGEGMRGLVHPCKIYNILKVGTPVLYIGPAPSHVTEILSEATERTGALPCRWVSARHGEVEEVVRGIKSLRTSQTSDRSGEHPAVYAHYAREAVLPRMIGLLEGNYR